MIVDRILHYLGGDRVEASQAVIDAALRGIERSLRRNLTAHPEEERRHLSASSHWYCSRNILYGLRGEGKATLSARARITFLMGDVLEQTVITLARLAGVNLSSPGLDGVQREHTVLVGGAAIKGHLDMSVVDAEGSEIPADVKSMNARSYGEFEAAILDPLAPWWEKQRWDYLTQLRLYMKAEHSQYGLFVGVCKDTGHMAEMRVQRDLDWENEIEDRAAHVLRYTMKPDELPPRPSWATVEVLPGANLRADRSKGPVEEVKHWRCGYCSFTAKCWDGFEVVPLTSGPKWRRAVEPGAKIGAE